MEASKNAYERIVTAADRLKELSSAAKAEDLTEEESGRLEEMKQFRVKYEEAMDDDLNTADALAAIFELVKFANTEVTENSSKAFVDRVLQEIRELCEIQGLIVDRKKESLDDEIEAMIAERQAARKAKDFARADEIRDELLAKGIILEDTREGVKWKRA